MCFVRQCWNWTEIEIGGVEGGGLRDVSPKVLGFWVLGAWRR